MVRSMADTDGTHNCHFMLEQNARGYFTGNLHPHLLRKQSVPVPVVRDPHRHLLGARFIERSLKDAAWTKPLDTSDCNATHPDCETVAKSGHILLLSDTL